MHSGEVQMAQRLQLPYDKHEVHYHPEMPMQHQIFFSNLPYFIFGNLDKSGRPWVTVLTGGPGFVTAIDQNHLEFNLEANKWDPVISCLRDSQLKKGATDVLFSGLGVDFSNRRRNKVAGIIDADSIKVGDDSGPRVKVHISTITQESLGNCPKYINIRTLKNVQREQIHLASSNLAVKQDFSEGLDQDSKNTILQVDTIFISTRHMANSDDLLPISDMDVNIRGGPKGFVRSKVLPDGKQLVWPDYSGNRFYQSLGNIESDKLVGMVFPNFITGDILYITGNAENLIGEAATTLMPSCELVTLVTITGYVFVKGGLDLEQQGDKVAYSPYIPPVRYLQSESSLHHLSREVSSTPVVLSNITKITPNIHTFTFTIPEDKPVSFIPGQHILIDFSKAKPKSYSHMNDTRPQRLNDDFVRSWTISSVPPLADSKTSFAPTTTVSCTIKLNEEGEITPFIYKYALAAPEERPVLSVPHRGVNGSFTIFNTPPTPESPLTLTNNNLLFIAGGIGVTPFLSFHSALHLLNLPTNTTLLFSGRNDELLLAQPFYTHPIFSTIKLFQTGNTSVTLPFPAEKRRMDKKDLEAVEGIQDKVVFVCGPVGFMEKTVEWLNQVGVKPDNIKQELFNF